MPFGASDWVEDQFITAIDRIFGAIADFLYMLMAEFLGLLEYFILRTPYPSCKESWEGQVGGCNSSADHGTAIIWDAPPDGTAWFQLYEIFEATQPYGYLMLFLAAVMGSFINVFYGLMPSSTGYSPKKLRQRIVLGFILVTFWWYIAVFMLAFADALTQALANAGAADTEASGLELGYAILMEFVEDATGAGSDALLQLGVTIVIVAIFYIKKIFLLLLLLLWILRIFVIYLGIPLMPLFIGMWAFALPGFSALNKIGSKALEWFSVLVFMSVPGGIFIGFSATVLEVVLEIVTSQDEGMDGIDEDTADTDNYDGGYEYDEPEAESVVINSQDSGSTGLHAESVTNNEAEIVADQIVSSTAAADGHFGGIILGLALGIGIAAAMPFIAALGPFIVVALGKGDAKTLAMGAMHPGAAIMSAASGTRGKGGFAAGMMGKGKQKAVGGSTNFADKPSLDKEAAAKNIDDESIESWDDMSRKQKLKAKHNQQGLAGATSFSSRIASQEVRENYDNARETIKDGAPGAYVKARALAGNKDYQSGVYNEVKANVGNSLRTGVQETVQSLPLQGDDPGLLQKKREDMAQRLNNAQARHESLKDESRKMDYLDAAESVDGSLGMSDRQEEMIEMFGDADRDDMAEIAESENAKLEQIQDEIQETREDRKGIVTDEMLEQKRNQQRRVSLAESAAYDVDFAAGGEDGATPLEKARQRLDEIERSEELGVANPDAALGGEQVVNDPEGDTTGILASQASASTAGGISLERSVERGDIKESGELEEILSDIEEKSEAISREMDAVQDQADDKAVGVSEKVKAKSLQVEKQNLERMKETVESTLEQNEELFEQVGELSKQVSEVKENAAVDESDLQDVHVQIENDMADISDFDDEVQKLVRMENQLEQKQSELKDTINQNRSTAQEARAGSSKEKFSQEEANFSRARRENTENFRKNVQADQLFGELVDSSSGSSETGINPDDVEAVGELFEAMSETDNMEQKSMEGNAQKGVVWNEN